MDGGPVRPIKFREVGPRPGPAHHNFRGWAAARPGPSKFQRIGRGPARPIIFSKVSAGPGPAHHIFKSLGPARPGPDKRPMTSPAEMLECRTDRRDLSVLVKTITDIICNTMKRSFKSRREVHTALPVQGSPSGCDRLEIPGVPQVAKRGHRRSHVHGPT